MSAGPTNPGQRHRRGADGDHGALGRRRRPGATGPGSARLAIPEYEALSASQVVKRLDGLKKKEL